MTVGVKRSRAFGKINMKMRSINLVVHEWAIGKLGMSALGTQLDVLIPFHEHESSKMVSGFTHSDFWETRRHPGREIPLGS